MKQISLNELQVHNRSVFLKPSIELLLSNGYKVVAVENKASYDKCTYFKFTKDGVHYGYMQQSGIDFWACGLSTVHAGSKAHGSGTRIIKTYYQPELKDFEETLQQTIKECKRYGLKPSDDLTFAILDYIEVVL